MAAARPCKLVWLFVREPAQNKLGPDKTSLPQDVRFTKSVKRHMLRAGVPAVASLSVNDPGSQWHQAVAHLDGKVVGAALVRPLQMFDVMTCLSSCQRCVVDYWSSTKHAPDPLLFLECVVAVKLKEPITVRSTQTTVTPTALFFECSTFSRGKILEQPSEAESCENSSMLDVLKSWQESRAFNFEFSEARACLCIRLPAAHALLLARRAWVTYAVPCPRGRVGAGLGTRFIADMARYVPMEVGEEVPAIDAGSLLDPLVLQSIADFIRKACDAVPALEPEGRMHVSLLQKTADQMVLDAQALSRKAFQLKHMVHCLVVSGFLRSSPDLLPCLQAALRVSVTVPELVQHLAAELCRPRKLPSPSSLYRHRLTAHIAFCRWVANVSIPVLLDGEGFCRWGTLDSSPQGAWDWLLAGSTLVAGSRLPECFRDANALIALGLAAAEVETEVGDESVSQQSAIAARLASHLSLMQGTPTAVGAGRASLEYKVHALAHSTRLSAPNWKWTCKMLNGTISWTADLGVESGLNTFRGNVCALFGDWAKAEAFPELYENAPEDDPAGRGAAEFDFLPDASTAVVPRMDLDRERLKDFNLDFTQSIYIPGPLHIMHNLTEGLGKAMKWWTPFVARLTHVCRLLKRKWNRARLLATCFSDAPWAAHVDLYRSFDGQVYEGRWGSVLHAVSALRPLEVSLRGAWSKQKFSLNGQNPDGKKSKSLDIELVDDACKSDLFWAYLDMTHELGQTIEHVMNWCESCPCHGHDKLLQGQKKHGKTGLLSRIGLSTCPLAGRRAPECAAGKVLSVLREGFSATHSRVLLSPHLAACGAEDQQTVVSDCSHARRYATLVASLKFSNWAQLPWVLLGIAHHNPDDARQCAAQALRLFEASTGDSHHYITALLCTPGTQGHEQMRAFIAGESLTSLPLLLKMASKFKFIPICERWIESRHALLKRHLRQCTHASAQHVAFMGCQPVLRDLLLRMPHEFNRLVLLALCTKNPLLALQAVGLHNHPAVQRALSLHKGELSRSRRPWVVELLYHVDKETLFQSLPVDLGFVPNDDDDGDDGADGSQPPPGSHSKAMSGPAPVADFTSPGPDSRPRPAPGAGGSGGGSRSSSTDVVGHVEATAVVGAGPQTQPDKPAASNGGILHDRLWCKYAVLHLRESFQSESDQPTCHIVCSLGLRLQSSLQSALAAVQAKVGWDPAPGTQLMLPALETFSFLEPPSALKQNVDSMDDLEQTLCGVLLFTVTAEQPANIKLPRHAARVQDADSLAISRVHVRHADGKQRRLFVSVDETQAPWLLMPSALSVDDFRTCRFWKCEPTLKYDFGLKAGVEFSDSMQGAILALVKAHRFHPQSVYQLPAGTNAERVQALETLEANGIALQSKRDAWTDWQLTDMGKQRLQSSQVISEPKLALQRASADTKLEDRSTFQLLCNMHAGGWSVRLHESTGRRGRRPRKPTDDSVEVEMPSVAYVVGGPKIWWLRAQSSSIEPEYLRALLSAESHGRPVPHFAPAGQYSAIVAGETLEICARKRTHAQAFQFFDAGNEEARLSMLVDKPLRAQAAAGSGSVFGGRVLNAMLRCPRIRSQSRSKVAAPKLQIARCKKTQMRLTHSHRMTAVAAVTACYVILRPARLWVILLLDLLTLASLSLSQHQPVQMKTACPTAAVVILAAVRVLTSGALILITARHPVHHLQAQILLVLHTLKLGLEPALWLKAVLAGAGPGRMTQTQIAQAESLGLSLSVAVARAVQLQAFDGKASSFVESSKMVLASDWRPRAI